MDTNRMSYKRLFGGVAAAVFLFVMSAQQGMAQQVLSDNKKKPATESAAVNKNTKKYQPQPPREEVENGENKWLLYGGAAALGIGVAALAGGGSSGSSTPACEEEIVGPSIAGSDWQGTLTIRAHGYEGQQEVTARITHCGSDVLIQTTSALAYGKTFNGTISSGGSMLVVEHVMRQDWTTHNGKATSTSIDLYDFVNGFSDLDSLELHRTLAAVQ